VRLVCTAVNFGLGQWGDEVFRTIAEATVHYQAMTIKGEDTNQLAERIGAAEAVLPLLNDVEAKHQRRRIAALKAARTLGPESRRIAALKRARKLGPEGRSAAAKKAWRARR
jgi:hypothetical protein